jgi:hypothetical protein
MTQKKQIAPLSVTIINQSLPQEQEQQEVIMMMVSPTSTTTPSPQHAAAAGVVGCVVSPTASSPSPVAAPATSLSPAVMRYLHDDRSEVSSLRCGSVPVNPNYDPAKDPFYTTQQFVVPSEIDIPSHKAKTIEIPVPKVVEQEGEESSLSPPDWLQLPDMKQRNNNNNNKKPKNKKDKGDGEQKEKQPTRSSKRRISIIGRGGGIRRRSFSEEGHDNIHLQRPNISQQQQQQQQQQDDELHRTYSEESPAAVARKQQQQQQQRKDGVVGLVQPATAHPRHRHTRSSPSSFFTTKKIVIAKNGRPVNAEETQQRRRQQQHYDAGNHQKKVEQQLSPTAGGGTTCAVGTNETQQQTKTIPLDFSIFVHPSYGSSNNKGRLLAVETSGSFTDSNQTTPTTQSSSSVGDGVVVMALPLMEPLEEIPEKKTTTKTAKKQNVVASSTNKNDGKSNSRPSPRKGMVRREFQRRFLWFTHHRKSKKEELQKLCSTMV